MASSFVVVVVVFLEFIIIIIIMVAIEFELAHTYTPLNFQLKFNTIWEMHVFFCIRITIAYVYVF
ncbi:hypothetical protein DFH27DRAFT_542945 [Peziza echinospora]|nr:hypothetical protein DFH27DRAFT_542945 [Peziza echinospora]